MKKLKSEDINEVKIQVIWVLLRKFNLLKAAKICIFNISRGVKVGIWIRADVKELIMKLVHFTPNAEFHTSFCGPFFAQTGAQMPLQLVSLRRISLCVVVKFYISSLAKVISYSLSDFKPDKNLMLGNKTEIQCGDIRKRILAHLWLHSVKTFTVQSQLFANYAQANG